jgi:PHD/YefM family antitoxin component YafN of YafNO toxin-antitoxin module
MDLKDLQTTTVNTRAFLHNFTEYQQGSKPLMITKHGKEQGVFIPLQAWQKAVRKPVYLTEADLKPYLFAPDGVTDLSSRVDEIYDF